MRKTSHNFGFTPTPVRVTRGSVSGMRGDFKSSLQRSISLTKVWGFIRVAAATPRLRVGNPDFNVREIEFVLKQAVSKKVDLVVFPELSISGYTNRDLFFQKTLQQEVLSGLNRLVSLSKRLSPVFIVGAPLGIDNKIFNTAVVIQGGKIWGIVPKTYLPGYKEFEEERWFASSRDLVSKEFLVQGVKVPVGIDLLFNFPNIPGAVLAIQICEDGWVPNAPYAYQVLQGATIIADPSASNDLVGKAEYRKNKVVQQSAQGVCGYIYCSCGVHESTTDIVFGGHMLLAENGTLVAESKRFQRESQLIISEFDLEHIVSDRQRMTSFGELSIDETPRKFRSIDVPLKPSFSSSLQRTIDPNPFVPQNPAERDTRCEEIFSIQTAGLAKRLESARIQSMILGLSGGLDSTLVLLVAAKTADLLKIPRRDIHCFTMPGFGTTSRTKNNAWKLAEASGVRIEETNIVPALEQHFRDIRHDLDDDSTVVFENAQARYRTMVLMDKANQCHGLVLGTGDLSEIALGWNTFTGDHIAHYNVNCSVPKTLVQYLVHWVAETQVDEKTASVLKDILDTPISPELRKPKQETIAQKTEELIGPYELHDFFLYHFVRWGSTPQKILYLAERAWGKKYKTAELRKWLKVFIERFFANQWKRSVATDGPKVGSVSLSPRGDWRMPSDADVAIWLKNL